jgi:competence protein ComEC
MPLWKRAPFIRLLLPFIAGIIGQWYLQFSFQHLLVFLFSFGIAAVRFKLRNLQGLTFCLLLTAFGMLVTWQKDVRHSKGWYGNFYREGSYLLVRIDEQPVEKNKSYKADGYVEAVINDDTVTRCRGKILLYFSKDSFRHNLNYGNRILLNKKLQAIKNSGNPGAFNYQRYAAFQQTFHNVFLKDKDWQKLEANSEGSSRFRQFIFAAREYVLSVLRSRVQAAKDELGIAEALLIGYTNDLDKDLVQAYSNTGVVHVIAISGMHLGLIYIMLLWLFAKIPGLKKSKWLQAILVLACLWIFSLLTGGSASVIRSAVMFTFITLGKTIFDRQSSIFSSLAASAFVMLCYNPYYLWDVGFQLSYLAVTGIVVFQKPIYNCIYIKNKWMDKLWQLMAVSTAAQLLTFPVCIYYFHQFPNLFLITNIIAVPLSAIILYAEIVLVAFSWIPVMGEWLGKLVAGLVWIMNKAILWINDLSFAVWDRIPSTVLSTWLLYAIVAGLSVWLISKNKTSLKLALGCLLVFCALALHNKWRVANQQKIIVYNVPQHQAIDFINGSRYQFIGDSILLKDGLLQNFHLKPGRIFLQLDKRYDSLPGIFNRPPFFQFGNKRVAVVNSPLQNGLAGAKADVDLVIISKNPRLSIAQLAGMFNCRQYVFDASNPGWKIEKWLQECSRLGVQGHSVPGQGAFILDIGI